MKQLAELYRFRALLANLVVAELKLRYRRSSLGFLWTLLNPLLMMVVLTLVFSTVMRFDIKNYAILLLAGLLPWTFFSQAINASLMSIVGKGPLLKKVYIPKAVIPLSAVAANLVNFILSLIPLFGILLVVGHPIDPAILFLPIAVILMTLFTLGLALVFSCLNVFYRDFGHMTEVLLQAWFYASPIIYSVDMVPEQYRAGFMWNPAVYLIQCFRMPIFSHQVPPMETIAIAAASSIVACFLGFVVFFRFENRFVLRV